MIYVGIGSNLTSKGCLSPYHTVLSAVEHFPKFGLKVCKQSNWYKSAPVPISKQPWFVNGVVKISNNQGAKSLLKVLHNIEDLFGRQRSDLNSSRTLDLDLLDYKGMIVDDCPELILPHPRMEKRAFVLVPLRDICPDWQSPLTGQNILDLITWLPADQEIKKIDD